MVDRSFLIGLYAKGAGDHPGEVRRRAVCTGSVCGAWVNVAAGVTGGCRCWRSEGPHGRVGPSVIPVMGLMPKFIQCSLGGVSVGAIVEMGGKLRAMIGGLTAQQDLACGMGTVPCCGIVGNC